MLKKILIGCSVIVLLMAGLAYSVFWFRFTDFYKDCMKVEVGMQQNRVEEILKPYLEENDRFFVAKDAALWGPGIYVSSNASGNSCSVAIKEGRVEKVEARFE